MYFFHNTSFFFLHVLNIILRGIFRYHPEGDWEADKAKGFVLK